VIPPSPTIKASSSLPAYVLVPLQPDYIYPGPPPGDALLLCWCSMVTYSLLSACEECTVSSQTLYILSYPSHLFHLGLFAIKVVPVYGKLHRDSDYSIVG
jgi:hypothetical protein